MPKLLFVGVIERTCRAAIIREIPGITDCFQVKEDGKKGEEPQTKVGLSRRCVNPRPDTKSRSFDS